MCGGQLKPDLWTGEVRAPMVMCWVLVLVMMFEGPHGTQYLENLGGTRLGGGGVLFMHLIYCVAHQLLLLFLGLWVEWDLNLKTLDLKFKNFSITIMFDFGNDM